MTTKILIADDHMIFRDGLRVLISGEEDFEVVGEAKDGREAVAMARELQPDLILMDIHMPHLTGIEATRQIIGEHPQINILILTMSEEDQAVFAAMRAGARGYILKGADHDEMLRAIRAIASGEAIFSPTIAARLMDFFKNAPPPVAADEFTELTQRELEVLQLIAQGCSNGEIAQKLVLSPKTVRNYVTVILSKLQVADRAQAIVRARKAGLG